MRGALWGRSLVSFLHGRDRPWRACVTIGRSTRVCRLEDRDVTSRCIETAQPGIAQRVMARTSRLRRLSCARSGMRTEHAHRHDPAPGLAGSAAHWAAGDHVPMTWSPGALATLLIAVVVTATPVFLHLLGPPIGVAFCVVLALLLANFAAPAVPITVLFS